MHIITEKLPDINEVFAFDLETDGLNVFSDVVGIGLSTANEDFYIPLKTFCGERLPVGWYGTVFAYLTELFNSEYNSIAHKIVFDGSILTYRGVNITNPRCTKIASWLLDELMNNSLPDLSLRYLGYTTKTFKEVSVHKSWLRDSVPLPDIASYCCGDSRATYDIHKCLVKELKQEKLWYQYLDEVRLIPIVLSMSGRGVRVNTGKVLELSKEYGDKLSAVDNKIYVLAGEFNIDSPKQLAQILHEDMKFPIISKTPAGQPSTEENTLKRFDYEFPKLILEHRDYKKQKSTYLDGVLDKLSGGRLHAMFDIVGTKTGRLSSSRPNLQNIPIRKHPALREIFIPSDGMSFIGADYNQVELRVLAHESQEPGLLEAFSAGRDIHEQTARLMFGDDNYEEDSSKLRYLAKTINFGLIYGLSSKGLSDMLSITEMEARALINRYFQEFRTLKLWMEHLCAEAERDGYVELLSGERKRFPELAYGVNKPAVKRRVVNYKIQGSAADICKEAMRVVSDIDNLHLLIQIHDELVFEAPKRLASGLSGLIRDKMEGCWRLSVPLKVSVNIGNNWRELK